MKSVHDVLLKALLITTLVLGGSVFAQDNKAQTKKNDQPTTQEVKEDKSDLVDINNADLATLKTLPYIGDKIGQRIIDFRTQHGGFKKLEEIMNVSGIGPKTYERIKDRIRL